MDQKVQQVDYFVRRLDKIIQRVDKKVHILDKIIQSLDKIIQPVDSFVKGTGREKQGLFVFAGCSDSGKAGWGTGIRTPISGVRVRCLAVRPSPKKDGVYIAKKNSQCQEKIQRL